MKPRDRHLIECGVWLGVAWSAFIVATVVISALLSEWHEPYSWGQLVPLSVAAVGGLAGALVHFVLSKREEDGGL